MPRVDIMKSEDQEWTYKVTQEEYDADIASGLTDEEVLRPGTYKLRRNPWAAKLREAGKVKVTIYKDDKYEDVADEYWLKFVDGMWKKDGPN